MINMSHHRLCLHSLAIRDPQSSTMAERIPSHLHPAKASSKTQGASSLGIAEEAAAALPQTHSGLRRQETLQSQNAACLGKAANSLSQPLRSSSLGFSILSYKSHSPKLIAYAVSVSVHWAAGSCPVWRPELEISFLGHSINLLQLFEVIWILIFYFFLQTQFLLIFTMAWIPTLPTL